MNRTLFRFADFQLDPAARELRQDGRRVALPPKSLAGGRTRRHCSQRPRRQSAGRS